MEDTADTGGRSASDKLRLCIVTTVALSIQTLYRGRLEYLREQGFDVTVVCATSGLDDDIRARGVRLHTAPMTRAITPMRDLRAIFNLWRYFSREQFDVVEVSTPKAALVGSIAGWLARVPCLIHVLRGLAYEGQRGWRGRVLRTSTAIPCRLAHQTISISNSACEVAYEDGLCGRGSISVLGSGSYNGVDLERFAPARRSLGAEVRAAHGITPGAVVIGFMGRMTRDKGLVDLVHAFEQLRGTTRGIEIVLALVGDYEQRDRPPEQVIRSVEEGRDIVHVHWQADPVPYLAAMDVFVLPTHREGLGNVLLEAAAMGLPTITTDATGCRDAVQAGVTGLQAPVGDVERLREALLRLVEDADLRHTLGAAGREWVSEHFDRRRVWKLYADEYRRLACGG